MVQVERELIQPEAGENGQLAQKAVVNQTRHNSIGFKVEEIIYFVTSLVEFLLLIRIVLTLLGANRDNAFASFVYAVTYPIAAPFFGLFSHTFAYGVARLEVETLVAMAVVGVIGWGIASLVGIVRR